MGINLPTHLVIIKNTTLYVEGSTQEYTTRQMLQMIGRAGRPQVGGFSSLKVFFFIYSLAPQQLQW